VVWPDEWWNTLAETTESTAKTSLCQRKTFRAGVCNCSGTSFSVHSKLKAN
jgi:hypothetical protein